MILRLNGYLDKIGGFWFNTGGFLDEIEKIMVRNFILVFLMSVVFGLLGCSDSEKNWRRARPVRQRIDTDAGMAWYLESRNLPALASVEVWDNEYGPGLRLVTAHYEIFTTLLEPLMLSQVPGFVESAYRGYQKQLPENIDSSRLFKVYLFGDREQWEAFTQMILPGQASVLCKQQFSAYYTKGVCVVYNTGIETTFSNLGHEGWHQFNSRFFKYRLPTWLDEGIAMLFEVSREDGGLFYFEPSRNGGRLGGLKVTLGNDEMIPLKELVSLNPVEIALTQNSYGIGAFYSQSYGLVRFLREAERGKRLGNYHRLLMGGAKGSWPLSDNDKRIAMDRNIPLMVSWNRVVGSLLFEHYVGVDFEQIEREYVDFCRKIVYHVKVKTTGRKVK